MIGFIDFARAKEAFDLWIQSLRVGPRYRLPFLGPTHEGVCQFIAAGLTLGVLVAAAGAFVWMFRSRSP